MVYGTRRPGGRQPWSRTFRKRGSISKYAKMAKPTAQNQKNQIVALAGQVQGLRTMARVGRQVSQYQYVYDYNLSADYGYFDIIQPDQWTNIFADPTSVENACRVKMQSVKFDMLFTCNTEQSPITFSCFLVTLKPDTADQLMSIAGSDLSGLVSGAHYAKTAALSGLVHLNEQFFTTLKHWQFTLTEQMYGSAGDPSKEASKTWKRISFKQLFYRRLWSGRNGWRTALTSDRVNSACKLYMLMFNDNSALDIESPHVAINAVIKCEAF